MNTGQNTSDILLRTEHLTKEFRDSTKRKNGGNYVPALEDVTLDLYRGETLGLVGESGCGKSTLALMISGFHNPSAGKLYFEGCDLTLPKVRKENRTDIQMIFQDSYSSLNPRKSIYSILAEPLRLNGLADSKNVQEKVSRLLEGVGLSMKYAFKYAGELSGGERQRVNIARAISLKPKLVVCDEPVSALDVSVQAQVLNLLSDLQKEHHLTYLFIAHGLGNVQYISDRIAVMYLGSIVEIGTAREIFTRPLHPYTEMFLEASPVPDPRYRRELYNILSDEETETAAFSVEGCKFSGRCRYASDYCRKNRPELKAVDGQDGTAHACACFLYGKDDDRS